MDPKTLIAHLIETYGMTPRDAERVAQELLKGNPSSIPDDPELGKTYQFLKATGVKDPVPQLPIHDINQGFQSGLGWGKVAGVAPEPPKEDPWFGFVREHPVRAFLKNELVQGGRFISKPVASPDHEKISAHKMLKEYLQAQDLQRANADQKDALNSELSNAQAWDNFFTTTGRPPASLGDFASAGAMMASQPKPEIK